MSKYISDNADTKQCDYCQKKYDVDNAMSMDDLILYIRSCILESYEDPANSLPFESKEGGYQGNVIDTYELVRDELEIDGKDDAIKDIIESLNETSYNWCQKDPFALKLEEEMSSQWKIFSYALRHRVRYMFYRIKNDSTIDDEFLEKPHEILERVAEIINRLDMLSVVPKGARIFRARIHTKDRVLPYELVEEVGPPSEKNAKTANRMNPAGVPMFYGASDDFTAISEIYIDKNDDSTLATIAIFETLDTLKVIDLCKLTTIPSFFDYNKRHERPYLIIIREFINSITSKIDKEGAESIEYVPSQVVAEYFRYLFRTLDGLQVQGIVFPSSKNTDKKRFNYALFLTCREIEGNSSTQWEQEKLLLRLIKPTRRVEIRNSIDFKYL